MTRNQQNQKLPTPKKPKDTTYSESAELTFIEHVRELRSRLFWIVLTIIAASAVGFQFKDQLIAVVMAPLHGQKLVYLTPGGGFGFIFTVAMYFGVLIAIPIIVYHVYGFLRPLLKRTSRTLVVTFMLLSCLLATAGAAFGYFVTIPAALDFLATFAGDAVTPNLTADSYLNFVVAYVLGLAILFQLPLLLFLFDRVRPFPPGSLLATQRFVIIGATVMAAIITPTPDAFNMAIVAVPIIAVYQLGVIAIFLRHSAQRRSLRREQKRLKKAEELAAMPVEQPLTSIFVNTRLHQPIVVPPQRTVTRRGELRITPTEEIAFVQEPEPVYVPHPHTNGRVMDGFARAHQVSELPLQTASEKRLAAAQATYVRPARSIDGFRVAEYQTNS